MSGKQPFFVRYFRPGYPKSAYGWEIVLARSRREITDRYPELEVVQDPPPNISDETLSGLQRYETRDIDDEPKGCLQAILEQRQEDEERAEEEVATTALFAQYGYSLQFTHDIEPDGFRSYWAQLRDRSTDSIIDDRYARGGTRFSAMRFARYRIEREKALNPVPDATYIALDRSTGEHKRVSTLPVRGEF